jgi:hypothetical protein
MQLEKANKIKPIAYATMSMSIPEYPRVCSAKAQLKSSGCVLFYTLE